MLGLIVDTTEDFPKAIVVPQGESHTIPVVALDVNGNPFDLTNYKAYFQIKANWSDVKPLVSKATANAGGGADAQMLIMLPQTGVNLGALNVFLLPADTKLLDPTLTYQCEARVVSPSGVQTVVLKLRDFVPTPALVQV